MKEGFLFGLGFSLVYFTFHYGLTALSYLLAKWEYQRKQKRFLNLAGTAATAEREEAPPDWRKFAN